MFCLFRVFRLFTRAVNRPCFSAPTRSYTRADSHALCAHLCVNTCLCFGSHYCCCLFIAGSAFLVVCCMYECTCDTHSYAIAHVYTGVLAHFIDKLFMPFCPYLFVVYYTGITVAVAVSLPISLPDRLLILFLLLLFVLPLSFTSHTHSRRYCIATALFTLTQRLYCARVTANDRPAYTFDALIIYTSH